jgi:hypothetical protein
MGDPADLATPWALRVVVTLRVAELIASGVVQVDAISREVRCDSESLARVLRHLIADGYFAEPTHGEFALNDPARALMAPEARLGLDLNGIGGRMSYGWSHLLEAVQTGRPVHERVFGRPFWDDLDANPNVAASFDELMGPAGHGVPDPEILLSGDWSSVRTVVDVGGGTGALLASVLRAHPTVHGILVDLPRTIDRADLSGDRVTLCAQSFFDPLPTGGDVYVLKNVLADWPDAEAERLLRRCAETGGRVVVLGGVSPSGTAGAELLMLVLVGGKSRSLFELETLAARAGLKLDRAGALPSGRYSVELLPA